MIRILVVEDEMHLAEGLRFNLELEGYEVDVIETGEGALDLARDNRYDAMVLDVMLPGQDGFSVVAQLRREQRFVPTLMLTARGQPEDVLRGFEAGADDYLTKPFELPILMARVNSLLRRRQWMRTEAVKPKADEYRFGDKCVNFELLELHVGDKKYPLTVMEANLLRYLIQREGKPVSRREMLDDVWGVHEDADTRPIDNFIVRLRRYLEEDPTRPRHLVTLRGVGYRFVAQP